MPGHRNLARENQVRRLETRRKNEDKVLVGFIKKRYPRVYGEAVKYMETLRAEYPDRKDLSKTKEFWDMLNAEAVGENTRVTTSVVSMDTFRLQIKLDEYSKTTQDPPAEVAEQASRHAVASTPVEQATPQNETVTVMDEGTVPDATLNLIDEGTLQDLIKDLREDPTIADFFSQMEYEFDNCPLW